MDLMLLLGGCVLLLLVLGDRAVRRLPVSPALLYLAVGWLGAAWYGPLDTQRLVSMAAPLTLAVELIVLMSLFGVGLRLRLDPSWLDWRIAVRLAGPGMVWTVMLGTFAAVLVLGLPWPAALLLAAVLAPTDPVLASEVQIRTESDRDPVRLALTAEGGLNDGTALPAVMLALGLLGWHSAGSSAWWPGWWWYDFIWPVGGGALIGVGAGHLLGWALAARARRGDALARDELLYVGAVLLAWGLSRVSATSSFVVVFAFAVALLAPLRRDATSAAAPTGAEVESELATRLDGFGGRMERLAEAVAVAGLGVALHVIPWQPSLLLFAAVLLAIVRPLASMAATAFVSRPKLAPTQRRLLSWLGIRGVGTLFYLAFALEHMPRLDDPTRTVVHAALATVALSIVLHGVSATPLMQAYRRQRGSGR